MFIKNKIKKYLTQYNSVVLWGAGGLAKTALKYWLPNDKIIYIIDDYVHKKNDQIYGKNIFSSKYLKKKTRPDNCM